MNPAKQLWWEKQRQRPNTRMRLNHELVLRKSVCDTAREYLSQCSIAGVKEIREPNIKITQRLTCVVIFIFSLITLPYLLRWTAAQTFSHPLVVTEESSTYPINQIDFPAVALCNVNRISKKALFAYTKELYENLTTFNSHRIDFDDLMDHIWQYGKLIDYSFDEDMRIYPDEFKKFDTALDSHEIVEMMRRLAPDCDEMLLTCAWAGQKVDCKEIFTVRRTFRGYCCVFNYILDYHSAGRSDRSTLKPPKRQNERGFVHGLHVVLDPMTEDYAYPIRVSKGFDIFLFDPKNYPDPTGGRLVHRFIDPNEASYLELQSVKQLATVEIQHYPKSTRQCYFHDELVESFGNMYSYSTCLVDCKIKTVKTLCKCTPFFLPISLETGRVCSLERLRCLNKYKEKMMYQYPYGAETFDGLEMENEDSLDCPDCRPDCEFTYHNTKAFKLPITLARVQHKFSMKEHTLNLIKNLNLTNKCKLSVFQSTGDGALNRLDVMSYWFEILSNVGGFAGILLGFSIISAIEIIYFSIFHFPYNLYLNYTKYY